MPRAAAVPLRCRCNVQVAANPDRYNSIHGGCAIPDRAYGMHQAPVPDASMRIDLYDDYDPDYTTDEFVPGACAGCRMVSVICVPQATGPGAAACLSQRRCLAPLRPRPARRSSIRM